MERLLMRGVNKMVKCLPGDFVPGSDAYEAASLAIDISVARVQSERTSSALAIQGDFGGSQTVLADFLVRRSKILEENPGSKEFVDSLRIVESWLGPGLGESIRSCLLDKKMGTIERGAMDISKSGSI